MEPTAPRDTPPRAVRDKPLMRADRISKKGKKKEKKEGRRARTAPSANNKGRATENEKES